MPSLRGGSAAVADAATVFSCLSIVAAAVWLLACVWVLFAAPASRPAAAAFLEQRRTALTLGVCTGVFALSVVSAALAGSVANGSGAASESFVGHALSAALALGCAVWCMALRFRFTTLGGDASDETAGANALHSLRAGAAARTLMAVAAVALCTLGTFGSFAADSACHASPVAVCCRLGAKQNLPAIPGSTMGLLVGAVAVQVAVAAAAPFVVSPNIATAVGGVVATSLAVASLGTAAARASDVDFRLGGAVADPVTIGTVAAALQPLVQIAHAAARRCML